MSEGRELRCYDYVNHPYAIVRDALLGDTRGIFQRATKAASTRAEALAANLRVSLGALEIGVEITIRVAKVEETRSPLGSPATAVSLAWQAVRGAWLFPAMEATLSLYALSATETQLDLRGMYTPPLGVFGTALDAMVGHRVAEASVLRFVQDVAEYLRAQL